MYELILIGIIIVLAIILFFVLKMLFSLKSEVNDLRFSKKSQSVKYGQLTEQWIPFSDKYPYNSQNFRFIGKPIDGISFEDDKIVFVEFKTNTSQLSETQRNVKELVENKKVEWLKFRID
ncbi:MAG: Holliday junction resolvase-like protein [Candidatus ainarchaeum sp.]|jgi:predicted Holliday junction resolvase-like endonuclease|nr:Holliday junction resolvase-like protein [Candidatus ainarchaeum sp.]MDD3085514.1 Holliday junction resolvase-like protein [Candidatus ainarchaeum sp.]MDD4128141.1 Holliday junction resolvase-like protein [Candidatus ainarchaeum sp.]MDD4467555.1 Holliday junction resolvase-like protein [Candidatus ainarchaeum sp.]HPM86000.1 Holliday junction resolvase-like protein [archaeon]